MSTFAMIAALGKILIFGGLCLAMFGCGMYATERLVEKLGRNLSGTVQGVAVIVGAILALGLFLLAFGSVYEF